MRGVEQKQGSLPCLLPPDQRVSPVKFSQVVGRARGEKHCDYTNVRPPIARRG